MFECSWIINTQQIQCSNRDASYSDLRTVALFHRARDDGQKRLCKYFLSYMDDLSFTVSQTVPRTLALSRVAAVCELFARPSSLDCDQEVHKGITKNTRRMSKQDRARPGHCSYKLILRITIYQLNSNMPVRITLQLVSGRYRKKCRFSEAK